METIDVSEMTSFEARIVYLMVYSVEFLGEFADQYTPGTLVNKYYDRIARYSKSYFLKTDKVFGDRFPRFVASQLAANKMTADEAAEMTNIFNAFSAEEPITDIEFETRNVFDYMRKRVIAMICDEAKDLTEEGKIDEAQELLGSANMFQRLQSNARSLYDYTDCETDEILNDVAEPVIKFPGALGIIMNDSMLRGSLSTFMGRMKVGKSWWLGLAARIGRDQGRRVILILAGDMTRAQATRRLWCADGRTTSSSAYLDKQFLPCIDCVKNQRGICVKRDGDGSLEVDGELGSKPVITKELATIYKPCRDRSCDDYKETVSYRKIQNPILDREYVAKIKERISNDPTKGELVTVAYPSGTLTTAQRRAEIKRICRERGWDNPDLVVVDYANVCAREHKDTREAINMIWQSLRADADTFNCLVLTAMHSNSASFNFEDLTISNFSMDNRILNEVGSCFAINQSEEEKSREVWRITALLKRDADYDTSKHAECYGCLAMGSPCFTSRIVYKQPPAPKEYGRR